MEIVQCEIDVVDSRAIEDLQRFFRVEEQGLATAVLVTGEAAKIASWLVLNGYEDVCPEVYPELFSATWVH